jgi:exodeoxyribonuclease VII small subunit
MVFLSEKEFNFESGLRELEKIVDKMENSEITLDDSVEEFQKGIKLSIELQKKLDEVEGKIQKLIKSSNGEVTLVDS